jgi:folate-binding protein YgfZ
MLAYGNNNQRRIMTNKYEVLSNRVVITLSGPERHSLLQGIITNNTDKLAGNDAIYAALLTPQGKYLYDFFLLEMEDTIYLECEKGSLPKLFQKLLMYRLRSNVEIIDQSEKYSVINSQEQQQGISFIDPRNSEMGYRTYTEAFPDGEEVTDYHKRRIKLGIAEGTYDYIQEKSIILEGHFEDLNGVDFEKGCYVGQEVIARMKYRGKIKKKMFPVKLSGEAPTFGTEILNADGNKIGDIRSSFDDRAIALFRVDKMELNTQYQCGNIIVTPFKPDWVSDE